LHLNLEQLYKNNFEGLHRYAFTKVHDNELASDLVQSVFLKFAEGKIAIADIANIRAYLYRMVHNACTDHFRQQSSSQHTPLQHILHVADESGNMQDTILRREKQEQRSTLIEKILSGLPPQARLVFEKSRTEGKKYREISEELGISEKTVEAHMSRALKIIRDYIRVNGYHYRLLILMLLSYAIA